VPNLTRPRAAEILRGGTSTFDITPYAERDRSALFGLLEVVDVRYPGGFRWLDRRLDDVWRGRARCTVVRRESLVVGAAIETPKGDAHLKLSTLWVAPAFRRHGAGTSLVDGLVRRWEREDVADVWVTTDLARCEDLLPSVTRVGFTPLAVCADRYGDGRCEVVYGWRGR
jgi:ribosomal protein S18 acetylase RimI-like enzyme